MTISQKITTPPTAPQRSDPVNFATRADAWVAWQEQQSAEQNSWAEQANAVAADINNDKAAIAASTNDAENSAISAANAADIALANANVSIYSAATTYAAGAVVQDPNSNYGVFVSQAADNIGHTPGADDGTWWRPYEINRLSRIKKIISGIDVKAICIHSAKDDDDPDWINKCGDTSHYNEQLNTPTRGKTRKPPAEVLIVGELNGLGSVAITIYDLTDPDVSMWMSFIKNIGNIAGAGVDITGIKFCNGELIFSAANSPNGELTSINFITEHITYRRTNEFKYKGNIEQRNDAKGWSAYSSDGIVADSVNDLAVTLLPNAPINPATGMRYPTIAVATDGGVSIIDGPAGVGTVKDSLETTAIISLCFIDKTLYYRRNGGVVNVAETYNADGFGTAVYSASSIPAVLNDFSSSNSGIITTKYGFLRAGSLGLTKMQVNPSNPSAGAVAYITNNYNTGLMRGDIKTCLMADTESGSATGTLTDRSVAGNDATITGTLTKSPVASGAELMAFGGFTSVSKYAEVKNFTGLNVGTGDFDVSIWSNILAGDYYAGIVTLALDKSGTSSAEFVLIHTPSNSGALKVKGNQLKFLSSTPENTWRYYRFNRKSGTVSLYIDAVLVGSFADTTSLATSADLLLGGYYQDGDTVSHPTHKYALLHVSATAPTPEQIKADYLAELPMFQENAKCTLSGSSNNVLALSYDDSKDEATVITDVVDTFNGLVNVKQASLTGTGQCVASGDGVVAIGTSSQASVEKPEISLREELAKQAEAPGSPYSQVWFADEVDGTETDFVLPSGYNVWAVYNEGMLVKEGAADQYTITDNGINKIVSFNVAPANGNDICVMIYKESN